MNVDELYEEVARAVPALFSCRPAPRGRVRVTTPMLYPDGGVVDVFVAERDDTWFVTDFGEALGWLQMKSGVDERSPKQMQLIQGICRTLRIELRAGQLELPANALEQIGDAVLRLAQAVVQVAGISFTMRTLDAGSMGDEVGEWLSERDIGHERGIRLNGSSGKKWTIDYRTAANGRTSLVSLLSTGSKGAAMRQTEHVVTGWLDLRHLREKDSELAMLSVFDDTRDVWKEEHFRLAEHVSEVVLWSQRDRFEQMLVQSTTD